ncbi:MAG: metallophosphoesterase [Thermoleophilia bacterium]
MHSFAVLSDTSPVTTARLTRMIVHRDPQALLFLGDHHPRRFGVSGMSARSWRRSVGAPLRDAVIAVPGNHDHDRSNGLAGWSKIVDGAWPRGVRREGDLHCFYADAGAVRFIGLDTGPEAQGVSDEHLDWLEALPVEHTVPVVALAHAPLAPVSVHIGRSQDIDPERRDRLAALLARLGVRLYLCGHEHLYAHRLVPAGEEAVIHQVTLGGGGASSYQVMTPDVVASASETHIGLLHARRDGVVLSVLSDRGEEIDVVRVPIAADAAPHPAARTPQAMRNGNGNGNGRRPNVQSPYPSAG